MSPTVSADAVPDLQPGINLLHSPTRHSSALHQLVCTELRERDGLAYWVDARNNASTYLLGDLVPSPRMLRDLRIARAFTAYQHHGLVRTLAHTVNRRTAFIVTPAVADLYRDDDIPDPEDRMYLAATVRLLHELGRTLDVPILMTNSIDDELGAIATEHAVQEIEVEETRFGYRFATDEFETKVYWGEGYWQTTIPYWVDLLGVRGESLAEHAYEVGLVDATV